MCTHNLIFCFRYNPCSIVSNCNSTENVALCQRRKGSPDVGALHVVGKHDTAYFDGRLTADDAILIEYPYKWIGIGWLECTVRVKCAQSSFSTFEYDPNSESSGETGPGPQSARFILVTPLACPPTKSSLPLWLIIVLSIAGLGVFCLCAGLITFFAIKYFKKSSTEKQQSETGRFELAAKDAGSANVNA